MHILYQNSVENKNNNPDIKFMVGVPSVRRMAVNWQRVCVYILKLQDILNLSLS